MKKIIQYLFLFLPIALISCSKNTTVESSQLEEFMPLQPGKFIRYRLDSMRFIDYGQKDTTISYDAKDVIDAEITDNSGRKSFRVVRYLRGVNSTDESEYKPSMTYMITPGREQVEVQENNLRYMKLRLPVAEGVNWHGNSYLPTTPFYEIYEFSNDEDMDMWNYTYQGVNQSVLVNDNVYDSTITVLQVADSINVPIQFPDGLAYRNYWTETFAKNIGLIYKEVVMWEYQPPTTGSAGFRSGFGLKMSIIEHN